MYVTYVHTYVRHCKIPTPIIVCMVPVLYSTTTLDRHPTHQERSFQQRPAVFLYHTCSIRFLLCMYIVVVLSLIYRVFAGIHINAPAVVGCSTELFENPDPPHDG